MARVWTTLSRSVVFEGVGLHSGRGMGVRVSGVPPGPDVMPGYYFGGMSRPIQPSDVVSTALATTVSVEPASSPSAISPSASTSVSTIEHLISALAGLETTAARIHVYPLDTAASPTGLEVPILDGSAAPFVTALEPVLTAQPMLRPAPSVITQPVSVKGPGGSWIRYTPRDSSGSSGGVRLRVRVAFPELGESCEDVVLGPDVYRKTIAPAPTFTFTRELEQMREAGLAAGGSLDNAVVFGPDGEPLVPRPHARRVPALHKILDLVGDLALVPGGLGVLAGGDLEAVRPGHTVNNAMAKALGELTTCAEQPC